MSRVPPDPRKKSKTVWQLQLRGPEYNMAADQKVKSSPPPPICDCSHDVSEYPHPHVVGSQVNGYRPPHIGYPKVTGNRPSASTDCPTQFSPRCTIPPWLRGRPAGRHRHARLVGLRSRLASLAGPCHHVPRVRPHPHVLRAGPYRHVPLARPYHHVPRVRPYPHVLRAGPYRHVPLARPYHHLPRAVPSCHVPLAGRCLRVTNAGQKNIRLYWLKVSKLTYHNRTVRLTW
ncbi:unnamed protein product [Macrosiphum euphorbiae]|nr:unnamed protein product [Macrosiphum euphorbiae]